MTDLTITTTTLDTIDRVVNPKTADLMRGSLAQSTWRAYQRDRVTIEAWGVTNGVEVMPATPITVANYVGDMVGKLSPATITRRVAMWSRWHDAQKVDPNPCRSNEVRATLRGLRREPTQVRQAKPLSVADLRTILTVTPATTTINRRDRALLTVGLALGCRRSELVALNIEDLHKVDQGPPGLSVAIRRSKTDQEATGTTAWLPMTGNATCPVTAVVSWCRHAGITTGAIFRSVRRDGTVGNRLSDRSVSTIMGDRATLAGLDPGHWSGHSLRSGFVTDHALRGASTRAIARQTGHSPTSPVIHRYVRDLLPWQDNAVSMGDWL